MRRVYFGLAAVILLVSGVNAQQGMEGQTAPSFWALWPNGGGMVPASKGARGMAMGGCYVATSFGHEALLKNPAGLAFAKSAEITVGGRAGVWGKLQDNSLAENEAFDDFSISTNTDIALWDASFSTNVPLSSDMLTLGAGLGWGSFYDNGIKWNLYYKLKNASKDQTMIDDWKGGLNFLAPAVGVSYMGRYAAGVSFGPALMSSATLRREYEPDDDKANFTARSNVKGSFSQYGFLLRPVDMLSVGFAYTGGMSLTFTDNEYEPDEGSSSDGEDIDMDVPGSYVFAVALMPVPSFTLTGEYGSRPLKKIEVEGEPVWNNPNIKDGSTLRAGLEFGSAAALRLGVGMDSPNEFAELWDGGKRDPAKLIVVTGGLGIPFGPVSLDAGAEYGFSIVKNKDDDDKKYEITTSQLRVGVNLTIAMDLFHAEHAKTAPAPKSGEYEGE